MTPLDAIREWIKRNAIVLQKITIADAMAEVQQRAATENKSQYRQHELEVLLNRFARDFQCECHTIKPSMIAGFLSGLMFIGLIGLFDRSASR